MVTSPLGHFISPQMLQHVDPGVLPEHEREILLRGLRAHKEIVGVVVRTGRMDKTVTVRIPGQRWEKRLKKVCLCEPGSQTSGLQNLEECIL